MIRQIFAAEINFEDTPLAMREQFTGTENSIKRILKAIRPRVDEVFALGNDQRFTLYAVHENITPITDFFNKEHKLKGHVQFYYTTEESVTHLFASTSGLLSQIKGEPQVLLEVNKCYQWAAATGCLGVTLDLVLRKAIDVGKAVRTATGIDKFCSSVVETGIRLLYNKLENLHSKTFLIIGTGKMARLALQYLHLEGMRNIVVTGHHQERVLVLAKKFGVKSSSIDKTGELFLQSDIIIGASHQLLKFDDCFKRKKNSINKDEKIRYILDFGIPRNFAPSQADKLKAELYNIDDLRRMEQSPLESFGGLELAWSMVIKESSRFAMAIQQLQHSPVLNAYLSRVFKIENREMRHSPKKSFLNILKLNSFSATPAHVVKNDTSALALLNNYQADNAVEIVKHVQALKKFTYCLKDN